MLFAVVGFCLIGDVCDGCGEQGEVAHDLWCGEDHVEVYAAALEGVVGVGGSDMRARCCLCGGGFCQ